MRCRKVCERIILAFIAAAFFCVSILFYVHTQNIVLIKVFSFQFLIFLAASVWIVVDVYRQGHFTLTRHPVILTMVVMLVYFSFSMVFVTGVGQKFSSVEEMSHFLACFLAVFLLAGFVRTRFAFRNLVFFILGVVFFTAIYGSLQYHYRFDILEFFLPRFKWGLATVPFVSTFANHHFFSGYLMTLVPLTFAYMFLTRDSLVFAFLSFALLFELDCILVVQSRGSWWGFIAAFPVIVILLFRNRKAWMECLEQKQKRNFRIFFVMLVLLGAHSFIKYNSRIIQVLKILPHVYFDRRYTTNKVRLRMWQGTMRMTTEGNILTGKGVGTFQMHFPYYRPDNYHRSGVSHNTRHPHCEYLEILGETGFIGLGIFFWFVIVVIVSFIHLMSRLKGDKYYPFAVCLFGGFLAALFDNMSSVDIRWPGQRESFFFVIGLGIALYFIADFQTSNIVEEDEEYEEEIDNSEIVGSEAEIDNPEITDAYEESGSSYPFRAGMTAFLLCSILLYYSHWANRIWEADKKLLMGASRIESNRSLETGLEYCLDAIRLNPRDLSSLYKGAYAYLKQGKYREALKLYQNITDRAANYAQVHNNIAIIHQVLKNIPRSLREFERATTIENNVKNHRNLATHYLNLNNLDSALYHLKRILMIDNEREYFVPRSKGGFGSIFPDWGWAHLFIARIYQQKNQIPRAKKHLEQALKYAPEYSEIPLARKFHKFSGRMEKEE